MGGYPTYYIQDTSPLVFKVFKPLSHVSHYSPFIFFITSAQNKNNPLIFIKLSKLFPDVPR